MQPHTASDFLWFFGAIVEGREEGGDAAANHERSWDLPFAIFFLIP